MRSLCSRWALLSCLGFRCLLSAGSPGEAGVLMPTPVLPHHPLPPPVWHAFVMGPDGPRVESVVMRSYTPRSLAAVLAGKALASPSPSPAPGAGLRSGSPRSFRSLLSWKPAHVDAGLEELVDQLLEEGRGGGLADPEGGRLSALLASLRQAVASRVPPGAERDELLARLGRVPGQERMAGLPLPGLRDEKVVVRNSIIDGALPIIAKVLDVGKLSALIDLVWECIGNDPAWFTSVAYPSGRLKRVDGAYRREEAVHSGCLMLPPQVRDKVRDVPILLSCHATELKISNVPGILAPEGQDSPISRMPGGNETAVTMLAPLRGFAVLAPDYPGMGRDGELDWTTGIPSPVKPFHPYCHADNLAISCLDMVDYVGRRLPEGYHWNGQLYVCGYSEGGFVAMACVRYLALHPDAYPGMKIRAAACLAGPFNTSTVMRGILLDSLHGYNFPFVVPYLCRGYEEVYHEPDMDMQQAFRPELLEGQDGTSLAQLVGEGQVTGDEVDAWIGGFQCFDAHRTEAGIVPRSMLREEWVWKCLEDEGGDILGAMRENDLAPAGTEGTSFVDWTCDVPILLGHNKLDGTVPYPNSELALKFLVGHGCDVRMFEYGEAKDAFDLSAVRTAHVDTFVPAVLDALCWLESRF